MERIEKLMKLDKMVKETRCYRSDACHHEDRLDDTEVIFELID